MAATGVVSITGSVTGLPTGSKTLGPLTIQSSTANGSTIEVALTVSTAVTVTIPTVGGNCTAVVFCPASSNTNSLTLKGVTGDTGIAISKVNPTVIPLDTSPAASFVVAVGTGTNSTAEVFFI